MSERPGTAPVQQAHRKGVRHRLGRYQGLFSGGAETLKDQSEGMQFIRAELLMVQLKRGQR